MSPYARTAERRKPNRPCRYRDDSDWKPYHHDAAALKPEFARKQNATVAASFGEQRDASFSHVKSGAIVSVPLPNGSMYAFGRDLNIEVIALLVSPCRLARITLSPCLYHLVDLYAPDLKRKCVYFPPRAHLTTRNGHTERQNVHC